MLFLWQKVRIDEFSRISNLSFFPSVFPVFPSVFHVLPHPQPQIALDFYSASSLFRTDCNVRVEAIAGYGETRTVAR